MADAFKLFDDAIKVFTDTLESVEPDKAAILLQGIKELEGRLFRKFPDLKRGAEDEEESREDGDSIALRSVTDVRTKEG